MQQNAEFPFFFYFFKIFSFLLIFFAFELYFDNRYVDRLVDSLKSKLETAEKMTASQKAVKIKYQEAIEEQRALEPQIDLIVEKTKLLLSQVMVNLVFYTFCI